MTTIVLYLDIKRKKQDTAESKQPQQQTIPKFVVIITDGYGYFSSARPSAALL